MAFSWIPLLFSTLQAQAVKLGHYVAAGSWCEINFQQTVCDPKSEDSKMQVVRAVLRNLNDTSFESATFVLPSTLPEDRLSSYHVAYDANNQSYRVSKTRRFVSTWSLAELIPNPDLDLSCPLSTDQKSTNTLPTITLSPEADSPLREPAPLTSISPSTDLGNGYYHSPTGKDWADVDEEERKNNASYYVSSSGVDWAEMMEEEDNLDSPDDGPVPTHTSQDTQVFSNTEHVQRPFNDAVRPQEYVHSSSLDDGFRSPMLRKYIPAEAEAEIQMEFAKITEPREDDFLFQFNRGIIEWRHMCNASQQLLAAGKSKRRPQLKESDRSVAWFCKLDANGSASGENSDLDGVDAPSRTREALREPEEATWKPWERPEEGPMHHFNYEGRPVFCKSATPPAVSLWAAFSSNLYKYPRSVDGGFPLRTHVLSSQAGMYLDPFTVPGFQQIPGLDGTALQEFVTGHVEKAYPPCGAWQWDDLEPDEDRPLSFDEAGSIFQAGREGFSSPVAPYVVHPERDRDILVNAEGHVHAPGKTRREFTAVGIPSMLSHVEVYEYSQDDAVDTFSSNDFDEQQTVVGPVADPPARFIIPEECDASQKSSLSLSDTETNLETRTDGSRVLAPSTWVEEVNQRLAQELDSISGVPRPRIRFGSFSTSSGDDDGASEYTDQSLTSSPDVVEQISSPSPAEEDFSYEDFCMQIKDISKLMEGLESDDDELSVCGSSPQGREGMDPKTQHIDTLAEADNLQPTPSQLAEEETAPRLHEHPMEAGTIDTLADGVVKKSPELVEESKEVGTADVPADEGVQEVEDDLDENLEEVLGEEVKGEAVQVILEEAVTEHVGGPIEDFAEEVYEDVEALEGKDVGVDEDSEEVIQEEVPEETGTTPVLESTSAENGAQAGEHKEPAELEASASDAEGPTGAFPSSFSLPKLSDCLLYGSVAAYVGFRVYRALKR